MKPSLKPTAFVDTRERSRASVEQIIRKVAERQRDSQPVEMPQCCWPKCQSADDGSK
jgi:hypothetical protein